MKTPLDSIFAASLLWALVASTPVTAAPETFEPRPVPQSYAGTIGAKAGNGVLNIAGGWIEVPKTMIITSRNEGVAMGLTGGFFKGLANMLGRTAMGVVDLATLPIPTMPMVEPPTVWQKFGRETTFNNTWELYETR